MIKDALIISVIAILMTHLIKSTSIYLNAIMYAANKGLKIELIDLMLTFLVAFVSVIIGKYII